MTVAPALGQVERPTARVTHTTGRQSDALAGVVPITSRRISAGVRPEPGATSRRPAWWSAEDWTQLEVPAAVWAHRELCRDHHVDPDTVVAVARGMARYADHRTGRDCRPGNDRLLEVLRLSRSTLQRARRVLKALGLVVELVAGRSVMTRAERLEAHRRGSSHRHVAATFALCSRRQRPREVRRLSPARPVVVDRGAPSRSLTESGYLQLGRSSLRSETATSAKERAPRAAPTRPGGRRPRHHPASRRLAEGVRRRLPWLRSVSAARLTPPLHRLAQAGWTERDVVRTLDDRRAARAWGVVPANLRQPAAYLATLLRDVDPLDRPGALDEQMAREEAAHRAYERQLALGAPCRHGQPAGDVPSPRYGRLACPACRAGA